MSVDTYSSWPFVSYDGPDDNKVRAEVEVVTGFGDVAALEKSKRGEAVNVKFEVSNNNHMISGWCPVKSNVYDVVSKAKEDGVPIYFRIERRRKDGVDRTTPISELGSTMEDARNNIFKSLAAVKTENGEDWVVSPNALTRLDEDPTTTHSTSAYNYSLEELREMRQADKHSDNASPSTSNKTGSASIESTPWYTVNANGEINPGSNAVGAVASIYGFVAKQEGASGATTKKQMYVAKMILKVCNKMQLSIYDGELLAPDLSLQSHAKARMIAYSIIESTNPLTEEVIASPESIKQWSKEIYEKGLGLWRWSINEVMNLLESE